MENMTGRKFYRLLGLSFEGKNKHGQILWRFKCDCGNVVIIPKHLAKNGHTKSCGCLHKETRSKLSRIHGMSHTKIYNIWCSMKQRCDYKKSINYHNYGGRGITYCAEWKRFENFFHDMKDNYDNKSTLDRIDSNKNYCKENCRWATNIEQQNNTRKNIKIKHLGKIQTLAEWVRELNLNYFKTYRRLFRDGWTVDKAFNTLTN